MAEGIFINPGELHMSAEPLATAAGDFVWSEVLLNRILVVLCIVIVLLELKDMIKLTPQLLYCIGRPRSNRSFEYNTSLARMRNVVALSCVLPFCLAIDRYALLRPYFVDSAWSIPLTVAVVFVYFLLRRGAAGIFHPRRLDSMGRAALARSPYNYFILLTFCVLALVWLLPLFGVGEAAMRVTLLLATGLFFVLSFIRSGQILAGSCAPLPTILYLCGLEILPGAAVLAPALLL